MKAHEFIRKTFDLDKRTSISELPNLPISLIVEMLNNYKEGEVKNLGICSVSQQSELLAIEALKKIATAHSETWSKQIATEALDKIANCG